LLYQMHAMYCMYAKLFQYKPKLDNFIYCPKSKIFRGDKPEIMYNQNWKVDIYVRRLKGFKAEKLNL